MGGVFIVLKTNPLAYLHLGLAACQLQKLYVFGLYLYGSGKKTGKFYEQTLDMCPLDFLQIPFISVQRAAYDAHFPTYHVGGYFFGRVITRILGGLNGMDETLHVAFPDRHRDFVATAQVTILHGIVFLDYRVNCQPRAIHKKQVLNEGHFLSATLPVLHRKLPHHRCEYLHPQVLEQLVCRLFGVAPIKIAHDEP